MSVPADPYVAGLRLLASRELSSARLAERLRRRGYAAPDVEHALVRLRRSGALDDRRAARSFADTFARRDRGRGRVLRDVETQGVPPAIAEAAVAEVFASIDERAVMNRILDRRFSGPVLDRAEFARLHRLLVRRGFPSAEALALLRSRRAPGADDAEGD